MVFGNTSDAKFFIIEKDVIIKLLTIESTHCSLIVNKRKQIRTKHTLKVTGLLFNTKPVIRQNKKLLNVKFNTTRIANHRINKWTPRFQKFLLNENSQ